MTDSFFDELEKIAVRLTKSERKVQAAKFTGLGAVTAPAVSALRNKIVSGKAIPKGTNPLRWAAGQAISGAVVGGALPAVRHQVERQSQDKARERLRAARKANAK